MATGIPRKSRAKPLTYDLSWPGKRERSELLERAPSSEPLRPIMTGAPSVQQHNRIVWGENSEALRQLLCEPELRGQVQLIYIDPPFATGKSFECRAQQQGYEDTLTDGSFLDFLYERLLLLRELLSQDGSIYLHLDQNMIFEAKLLLDEVFGRRNFRNLITRKKCNRKNYTKKQFGNISDHILFYSKSEEWIWNRPFEAWSEEKATREYPCREKDGRRFKKVPIHAPGVRNGATGQPWKGMVPPPGKHWQYTPDRLDAMNEAGQIYWSPTGNPRKKIYLDQSPGLPVQDLWMDQQDPFNQNARITGYPTEKSISLLARIVQASSLPGGLVLDAFMGSGTTLEAAAALGRKYIGIDASPTAIEATLKRLLWGRERMGDFVSKPKDAVPSAKKRAFPGAPLRSSFTLFAGSLNLSSQELRDQARAWSEAFQLYEADAA